MIGFARLKGSSGNFEENDWPRANVEAGGHIRILLQWSRSAIMYTERKNVNGISLDPSDKWTQARG